MFAVQRKNIKTKDKHIVCLTYTGFADGKVRLSDEHSEYRWLSVDEISALKPMDEYFKDVLAKFDLR